MASRAEALNAMRTMRENFSSTMGIYDSDAMIALHKRLKKFTYRDQYLDVTVTYNVFGFIDRQSPNGLLCKFFCKIDWTNDTARDQECYVIYSHDLYHHMEYSSGVETGYAFISKNYVVCLSMNECRLSYNYGEGRRDYFSRGYKDIGDVRRAIYDLDVKLVINKDMRLSTLLTSWFTDFKKQDKFKNMTDEEFQKLPDEEVTSYFNSGGMMSELNSVPIGQQLYIEWM